MSSAIPFHQDDNPTDSDPTEYAELDRLALGAAIEMNQLLSRSQDTLVCANAFRDRIVHGMQPTDDSSELNLELGEQLALARAFADEEDHTPNTSIELLEKLKPFIESISHLSSTSPRQDIEQALQIFVGIYRQVVSEKHSAFLQHQALDSDRKFI